MDAISFRPPVLSAQRPISRSTRSSTVLTSKTSNCVRSESSWEEDSWPAGIISGTSEEGFGPSLDPGVAAGSGSV